MHVDPRQLPTDLKEPAMDAGYPPDRRDTGDDERCNWCQRGGEMQGFEGRLFCGEDCANHWWWEWNDD
jgi:hypothetical protein